MELLQELKLVTGWKKGETAINIDQKGGIIFLDVLAEEL